MVTVRAVYEDGHLRLLDPVNLAIGEEVQVAITSERERVLAALGDLIAPMQVDDGSDDDIEMDMAEIERELGKARSISEIIIEERKH